MNKTLQRIIELIEARNWTKYRLARESGIPYSSLNSLFLKNNQPTLSTLEKICAGLNISLSDFFSDYIPDTKEPVLSKEDLEFILKYQTLSKRDKQILTTLLHELCK